MLKQCINLLFISSVAIILTTCESTYLKYYMSDYCLNDDNRLDSNIDVLNDSAIDTSILLESSRKGQRISNKTCVVRIVMSERVHGLIVTVLNISINNTSAKTCADYIQFGSSPIGKWCNSSDAQDLIFSNSSVDILLNTQLNSNSYFRIAITPYENPISGQLCTSSAPFKCENSNQLECISKSFRCDGIDNCANGVDEHNCTQHINAMESKTSQMSDTIQTTDNIEYNESITSQTTTNESETVTAINLTTNEELSLLEYNEYDILKFCNSSVGQVIELQSNNSNTTSPAILILSPKKISNQTCSLRFIPPKSTDGLIVGIDKISIKNNDYIEISGSDIKTKTIWNKTKTDITGKTFAGSAYIDIVFHAGNDSNSQFQLVITEFEEPTSIAGFKFCLNSSTLRCSHESRFGDNECILKQFKCDGHRNCPTGLDEPNDCPIEPTTAPTTNSTTTSTTIKPTTTTTPKTTTTVPTTTTTTNSTTTEPTTTHNSTITTVAPTEPSHKLSPGWIVLIVIGSTVAISLIVFILYRVIKKRRENTGYSPLND